jgi:hypothetical protein
MLIHSFEHPGDTTVAKTTVEHNFARNDNCRCLLASVSGCGFARHLNFTPAGSPRQEPRDSGPPPPSMFAFWSVRGAPKRGASHTNSSVDWPNQHTLPLCLPLEAQQLYNSRGRSLT